MAKNIEMRQINVVANTFDDCTGATLVIESYDDEEYRVELTKNNTTWLIEALKRARKLSEMGCN